MIRRILIAIFAALAVVSLASCSDDNKSANKVDREASEQGLEQQQKSQPVPVYDYSQYRQNLIELTDAKANATQTTSFFWLEGVGIVDSCPSIGFPIPSTAQLTNPQVEKGPRESRITLPQVEPTGVYTGDSTGTYTICVDADGVPYANYFEGYVQTVTGPAKIEDGRVVLTGEPTGEFTAGS